MVRRIFVCARCRVPRSQILVGAINQLAALGGWEAAVLVGILDPVTSDATLRGRADAFIRNVLTKVRANGCPQLKTKLDTLTDDSTSANLVWEDFEACADEAEADALRGKYEVLTVAGYPGDQLRLISGGIAGEPAEHVIVGSRAVYTGRQGPQLFVALVRRWSWTTLHFATPHDLPRTDTYYVNAERRVRAVLTEPRCLDLNLGRRAQDLMIFVNGNLVQPGLVRVAVPLFGRAGPGVQLSVLRRQGGAVHVIESRVIPWQDVATAQGCQRVALDISNKQRGDGVAIVHSAVGKTCAALGVDDNELRSRVEQFFRRRGTPVRPVRQWAETARGYFDLVRNLARGAEVGGSRARLDAEAQLGTGASEVRRQGIDTLISLELSCMARSAADLRFSIQLNMVRLRELNAARDPVEGVDVSGALTTEIETGDGGDDLDVSMEAALLRLLRQSYVRFTTEASGRPFRHDIAERVAVFVPGATAQRRSTQRQAAPGYTRAYQIALTAQALRDEDLYVCGGAREATTPLSREAADRWWRRQAPTARQQTQRTIEAVAGAEVIERITWDPARPGRYLVKAELRHASGAPMDASGSAYRCVTVMDAATHYWVALGYARGINFTPSVAARADTLSYGHLLGGVSYRGYSRSAWLAGVAVGYGNAVHSRETPPSWELGASGDGGLPAYDSTGQLDLTWTRQSVVVGPTLTFRLPAPICVFPVRCSQFARSFDVVLRAIPLFDVGKIDADAIDERLRTFLSGSEALDLDLSAVFELGVQAQVTRSTAVYGMLDLVFLGWDDFVLGGRDQRQARATITYDAHVLFGGQFGVAWTP
jgi:hypothetical protein